MSNQASNLQPTPQTGQPQAKASPSRVTSSIKTRWLALLLGTTILAVIGVTAIAINTANILSRRAQDTSSQSMRTQAETNLTQVNGSIAQQNDLILDRAGRDIQAFATAIASIYANPDITTGSDESLWPASKHMYYGSGGQYLNSGTDTSSVFVPVNRSISQSILRDIELGGYLDLVMEPIFKNNPNAAAVYFGTIHDVTRYYPNIKLGEVVPPDFQVTQRIWYTSAVEQNPDAGQAEPVAVWSPVYLDATGLGLVTTVAVPVYDQSGQLIGVAGLDLTLNEIQANIEASRFQKSGYSFLIDQDGKAIILPDQGYQDILGRPPEADEYGPDLKLGPAEFSSIIERMTLGETGFVAVQSGDRELFLAFAPLPSSGWSLGSVVAAEEVLESISALQDELSGTTRNLVLGRVLPIATGIALVLVLLGLVWTNRLVNPIQKLAEAAQKIGAGQWDVDLPVKSNDEVGLLSSSLGVMAKQLQQSFRDLEKGIADRTYQLQLRSLQLRTSAEVVRAVASIRNLDELLHQITHTISERFGFYHVGVFLVDENSEYVVLRAANSAGGERMLTRGHKLRIGQTGIVGAAAGTHSPHTAMDVDQDIAYFRNPDLEETRSEMALPLITGDSLLGVLDIQSTLEAAFVPEDIEVLQILADQIAVAIENAQLFTKNQEALSALERAYGSMSEEAWRKLLRTQGGVNYVSVESGTQASMAAGSWSPDMLEARKTGKVVQNDETLTIPIKLREQVLGVIKLRKPDGAGEWTEQQINLVTAIDEQLSAALESARLYQETTRRAERERLTGEITAKMRASSDPQTILLTAVRELRKALQADRTQVLVNLNPSHEENDQAMPEREG